MKDVKEGYNANFERKNKRNIRLIKIRKIIKDLDSGKINSVDSLKGRHLKDISRKKNPGSDSKGGNLKKNVSRF